MSALDWLLLGIVAASAVLGLARGFVGVVASIAAWLLGAFASLKLGGPLAVLLAGSGTPDATHLLLGHGACFLATALAVSLLAWLVRRLLHGAGLGSLDRGLGLAFGTLRGVLVGCVVVLLLGFTGMPREPHWQASAVLPWFTPGARWLSHLLPGWATRHLDFDGSAAPAPVAEPA